MFAKHGLRNLIEKINLASFLPGSETQSETQQEHLTVARRMRLSFEELGPTFVKFGQLLASRPDLIPDDFMEEMALLHDQVMPLDFITIQNVLTQELGADWSQLFSSVEEKPLGSASIAQVHKAILKSGETVVLKIQRPGLVQIINDDLNVLYFIAELLEKYIPEVRPFNPLGMVDEYFKTLELETNFVVEANNIRRFKENFKNETDVVIPQVFFNMTSEKVLVMQYLNGKPLSQVNTTDPNSPLEINTEDIIKKGLKAYLKMVFVDGFFHGDLHAGNFFIMPDHKIGLVDFGVVGRLNAKTQSAIVNMLIALSKEDYLRLAYEYVDLAPYSEGIDVDLFAKDLQGLIAPYYGLTLKNVNIGQILLSSSGIAAAYGLIVPTELMLFFKSIISIEGLGKKINREFDFLQFLMTQVSDVAQSYFQPVKMMSEASLIFRESKTFFNALPRQLNLIMRKMNSPDYKTQIAVEGLDELKFAAINSTHLLFLGIIIAALLLSSSLIFSLSLSAPQDIWMIAGLPALSFIGYALAGLLSIFAFFNYMKSP